MRSWAGFRQGSRTTAGRRRVLFFGTYDASIYPRVAVLREGFAGLGDEVLECNEPLRIPTGLRVRMLREPWRAPVLLWAILRCWARLAVRARHVGHVDLIVVGYMGQFDVHLARALWPRVPIVLDHLVPAGEAAVDRRCKSRLVVGALRLLDWAATRTADVVCVDTDEHLAFAGRRGGLVVPVGAPEAWFSAPGVHADGPLRVIFFGSFTPLQGAPVIAEAAAILCGGPLRLTIVGRGQDWDVARERAGDCPNIEWIDWVEPELLPALVAEHDVVLGIFGTGAKALSVVPTKVFQGAAAGAAIVTSDTPPQRAALGDAAAYVEPGDAGALARTLLALAADRARVEKMREAAFDVADARFRPVNVVAPLTPRARVAVPAA
ncbi:MAG TPA: glycosyltransferase [Gaiellaceae bacterium]|jgi:glycosyltransferase involved in cell wall biosynthesis|nr:glycosyltransferase [Gaiellaceae bacterium]